MSLISSRVYSQNTISGKIKDAVSDKELYGVSIYIKEINKVVSSDSTGNFKISGLPGGFIEIRFSLLNYKTFTLSIETDKIDKPVEIKLIPSEISTEEIIVTDSTSIKTYQTDKINFKDLMRLGAMNISEALTIIPGVWQLSTGTGISKPVIRGLYGNRIGIMVNGIRFDNQQWQDEHGLVMSSDGIDNIEVIKGPRSLLFGPEAIGGVVSITDELPAPIGSEIADMNLKFFTNTLGILGNVGLKGAEENYNWLIRFGGETHADYLDGNGDRIPETRFGGYNVKANGGLIKGNWAGRLNYSYTNYTYGILEGREFEREIARQETRFDRSFNGPHHLLKVHNLVFQNTFIKERSTFKVNAGYIYNRRKEQEGNDERFLPDSLQFGNLDMILNTLSLDAGWKYILNNNTQLTVATQEFYQSNTNTGVRRLIPDAYVTSASATGILNFHKGKFTFEGGARYDYLTVQTSEYGMKDSINYFPEIYKYYNSVNGSAGLTYFFTDKFLLKANFSTGFRAPNLAELTSNGLHEGVFQYEIGNVNFTNEQSVEVDVTLNYSNRNLSLELTGYNNHINNYIYLAQTADTLKGYPVFRYFQDDANLNGIEASINYSPSQWLNLYASYSTVIATRSDGENLPLIPADKITGAFNIELDNWKNFYSPYFEISAATAFEKTRLAYNETGTPSYTLLNMGFGCDLRFEKQLINITLTANNLFNKVYIDFMSRIKLLNATYNGTTFYANNQGRSIVLSVKIPFKLSYN
ncbi:MAG TPA: TonB-dependent receptor [Ignavibacteria bacterium]|nr:TonB-dependent receptor [Ignavibacteria bacterium]